MDNSLFVFFISTLGAVFLFVALVLGVTFVSFTVITKLVDRKNLARARRTGIWWEWDEELKMHIPTVDPQMVGWDKYPDAPKDAPKDGKEEKEND